MPLFAPGYEGEQLDLVVALSRIMFPILVLLGVTGMVVGVLNSYNRFAAFALSPLFWNLAIIAVMVGFIPAFPEGDEIYVYAVAILVGTVVQLAIPAFDIRNTPFRLGRVFDWRSPTVRRVLVLMLPVTISLGLINFNVVINSFFGTLISDPVISERAPAAIDKAFRVYMLPQGVFSVAVATVLFPTLARFAARGAFEDLRATMANGMRQIALFLIPATAAILVLSEPMIRLVYQRGEFDASQTELVATALFWFAFSLPFNGMFLLLTRTFFSLQRPWVPTAIAGLNLVLTAARGAGAVRRVRGGGDRRRDGDRDGRERDRRRGRAPAPARRPGARPPARDGRAGDDRRGCPGRRQLPGLEPARRGARQEPVGTDRGDDRGTRRRSRRLRGCGDVASRARGGPGQGAGQATRTVRGSGW